MQNNSKDIRSYHFLFLMNEIHLTKFFKFHHPVFRKRRRKFLSTCWMLKKTKNIVTIHIVYQQACRSFLESLVNGYILNKRKIPYIVEKNLVVLKFYIGLV